MYFTGNIDITKKELILKQSQRFLSNRDSLKQTRRNGMVQPIHGRDYHKEKNTPDETEDNK